MRGIFLSILIFSLFIPNKSQSANTSCTTITDGTTCWNTPGCQKNDTTGDCEACDAAFFCPGGENNKKACTDTTNGAGPDFPFAHQYMRPTTGGGSEAVRGARTKYECYKQLDEGTGNGHGAKCIGTNGEPVNGTCREYYRDGTGNNTTINLNSTTYTYKGNAAHHWVSCPDANNQYDIGEGSGNTPDSAGYHMEENNAECYANTLACSKFNSTQGDNNIQCGYDADQLADYNSNDHHWTFTNCLSCKTTGTATQYGTYLCEANWVEYGRASSASPTFQSVNSATLTFNSTPNDWDCTGCKEGYIGFFKYSSASHNNQKKCMPAVNGCYSDGCALDTDSPCFNGTSTNNQPIVFPYSEYYPSQFMCDNIVPGYSYYWDTLKKFYHSCYAGMTSAAGSDSPEDCHYTNATNFCDAYGCVSMDQLLQNTGTSQGNWTWYMQQ